MPEIDGFTHFLLTAHLQPGGDNDETFPEEVELAERAGALAEREGWTYAIGALLGPHRDRSISASLGEITIVWDGWKTRSYATNGVSDTIQALVTARILPWIYSPYAQGVLDELASDLEDEADQAGNGRGTELRNTAERVGAYLKDRHRDLYDRNDDVRVA